MQKVFQLCCALIIFDLLAPGPAQAYIDPGVGSMLLQALAAGAISLLVFWRGLRRKIAAFFAKKDQRDSDGDS